MARGDELLIVESNPAHQKGMRKLFADDEGYVVTAVGTRGEARDLIESKFFPAALVDLDVERPGAGLDLVRFVRERSAQTSVVLLTGRRSYEAAVDALRLGVADVVHKSPDSVPRLRSAVSVACDRFRASQGDDDLLNEVRHVLDESFRIMLHMARHVYHDISIGATESFRPRVLIVDSDQEMLKELAELLQEKDWEVAAEMTGGAALDKASSHTFEVVAVRHDLMDLRGTMVVKSIQASHAETVGLVYTAPGAEGRIEKIVETRTEDVERPFKGAAHLLEHLEAVVERLGSTRRDRRVIQAFRGDHSEYFRRYAQLKLRIDRLVE